MTAAGWRRAAVFAIGVGFAAARASGQDPQAPPPESDVQPPSVEVTVDVVAVAPLPGVERPVDQVAAPVQTARSDDLTARGSTDLSGFLNHQFGGVHVNEIQGNPFQTDVNFRGYTASPLLGTPQGLSVYMDGVRLNQPFGEVVSWDLVPRAAIASTTLVPGSNPLFGLNTLGGAVLIETKSGLTSPGTSLTAQVGSDARRAVEFEHGGANGRGLDWYVAGNLFADDGWREESPSDVRQVFGKIGWTRDASSLSISIAQADNSLIGNGLQEVRLLERDYAGIYTKPDITDNQATLAGAEFARSLSRRLKVSGNAYYRHIHTGTVNGDVNDQVFDGSGDVPLYDGLLTTTATAQHNYGAAGQLTLTEGPAARVNQLTAGAAFDGSRVGFAQAGELGFLTADRGVLGSGAEDEAAAVDLSSRIRTWSAYATDTLSIDGRWHVTLSGRFNRTRLRNRDGLQPGGGPGSLDGDHVFQRLNPAAGVTFTPSRGGINLYAGYSEGSRAPASVELGCADPDSPCRLPNAMAGDPPLDQVIARTWEAGVRSAAGRTVAWSAGVFRARNDHDILFVASGLTGFGYFTNFGRTRRQGVDLSLDATAGRARLGAAYTFLDATYQSAEIVNGESNSTAGEDGTGDGQIAIAPGDRLPLVPRHLVKLNADIAVTARLSLDADLVGVSRSFARGNENNRHDPDGVEFLGPGTSSGYAVVNAGARYQVTRWLQAIGQVANLLDRRYASAAQLGPTAFDADGVFSPTRIAQSTFVAPGAPRQFWVGTRISF